MYLRAVDLLAELGYCRYEISNFAKGGHYSRHNMRYWECGEYLALGPAAHSNIDSLRYSYSRDVKGYIKAVSDGHMPEHEECTLLSAQDKKEEYIMLSLRLEKGLSLDSFENRMAGLLFKMAVELSMMLHVTAANSEIGIVSTTIIVARQRPRNRNTTIITSNRVVIIVSRNEFTVETMLSDVSTMVNISTSAGRFC